VSLHPPPTKGAVAVAALVAALISMSAASGYARRGQARLWAAPTHAPAAAARPAVAAPRPAKGAKVAVLGFGGDGSAPVRKQVIRVLRAKGFRINAGLRPVDSAGQYREMADALGLTAYLDGDVRADGDQRSATIRVRSGRTGLHVTTATFTADRGKLSAEIEKALWRRLGLVLAQASTDAARPHKREHALRINAGTPID
jgi:hypothetical protein